MDGPILRSARPINFHPKCGVARIRLSTKLSRSVSIFSSPFLVEPDMEPSQETLAEIGALCIAYSYLESRAEATIWGILNTDERIGTILTGRLDLRSRFQLIVDHAEEKHTELQVQELKEINKALVKIIRDRNIIVHGIVHAEVNVQTKPRRGEIISNDLSLPYPMSRIPCWTIFKGADAGKSFPISRDAVRTVRQNVQNVAERLRIFNSFFQYHDSAKPSGFIETQWPERLL